MNEEITKLAKEAWGEGHEIFWFDDDGVELFYRAAYNKAIEDAAKETDRWIGQEALAYAIRALELK